MGLVESWGTGIRRIMKAAEDYGLPKPEFQAFDDMFRVNLFRRFLPMPELRSGVEESTVFGEASEKI